MTDKRDDGPFPHPWSEVVIPRELVENLEALWSDKACDPTIWDQVAAARRYGHIALTSFIRAKFDAQEDAKTAPDTTKRLTSEAKLGPKPKRPTMLGRH